MNLPATDAVLKKGSNCHNDLTFEPKHDGFLSVMHKKLVQLQKSTPHWKKSGMEGKQDLHVHRDKKQTSMTDLQISSTREKAAIE